MNITYENKLTYYYYYFLFNLTCNIEKNYTINNRTFHLVIKHKNEICAVLDLIDTNESGLFYDRNDDVKELKYSYIVLNNNNEFCILNSSIFRLEKNFGKLNYLFSILKNNFPELKTDTDFLIEDIANDRYKSLVENKKLDEKIIFLENVQKALSEQLERQELNSKQLNLKIDELNNSEILQQEFNFKECSFKNELLIARKKIELPKRKGFETTISIYDTRYNYEKSSTYDAFDFFIKKKFNIWILKIVSLGKHEEFGYALMGREVIYYSFDNLTKDFISLDYNEYKDLLKDNNWFFWERELNK
jgi:hypothetical protein